MTMKTSSVSAGVDGAEVATDCDKAPIQGLERGRCGAGAPSKLPATSGHIFSEFSFLYESTLTLLENVIINRYTGLRIMLKLICMYIFQIY